MQQVVKWTKKALYKRNRQQAQKIGNAILSLTFEVIRYYAELIELRRKWR
jgi:hypothetical protein